MAASEEIHIGDTGTVYRYHITDLGVDVDLSAKTTLEVKQTQPSGTSLTHALSFTTDGTDGRCEFTSTSATWPVEGTYSEQVRLVDPSGEWRSNINKFKVYANL